MKWLCGTVLMLAVISAAVLSAVPASSAPAETVKVYYQDVPSIKVDFLDGKEIEKGGRLTIVTSSQVYDMEKSGIMFYERGQNGPDLTAFVTPDHHSFSEGNVVTHVFSNLTVDIEMHFTELKELEAQPPAREDPVSIPSSAAKGDPYKAALQIAPMILAVAMLCVMARVIRMVDGDPEAIS